MSLDLLLSLPQYSLAQEQKERLLLTELVSLHEHHVRHNEAYRRLNAALPSKSIETLADLPYVPVGLFKSHRLQSVTNDDVFKIMTSSGTTGSSVSQVVLDRRTAELQTRALAAIMTHVLGKQRLPMIIVDTPNVIKDRKMFSARGAGILGMMNFGRQHFFALDDEMNLNLAGLEAFLEKHASSPLLIFGFTFMVWKYFYSEIKQRGFDLSRATLIHSGGWKKLIDEAVGNDQFKASFKADLQLQRVHNFYGMVEQVGSVFVEGVDGYLYAPNFAEVIVRDPHTWREAAVGEPGVIQVLSALPFSYPGHSILTEDWGIVEGVSTPDAGWAGKRLRVLGRVPKAELRGCSDTHAFGSAT